MATMRSACRATKVKALGSVRRPYQISSVNAASLSYVDRNDSGEVFNEKSRKALIRSIQNGTISSS